jgi:hypothetical protein
VEIKKLSQEKNSLLEIIRDLKISLYEARNEISDLKSSKIDHIAESKKAMKRYTEKLKKEMGCQVKIKPEAID